MNCYAIKRPDGTLIVDTSDDGAWVVASKLEQRSVFEMEDDGYNCVPVFVYAADQAPRWTEDQLQQVERDAQMIASKMQPLPLANQAPEPVAQIDWNERADSPDGYKTGSARSCTCHPDDNPPKPCPQKYALSECRESAIRASEQKHIHNLLIDAMQSDLEHGVKWLNEDAAQKFSSLFPALNKAILELKDA